MLSRVFKVAPLRLASYRAMHVSAVRRADLVQDLYSQEIKSFQPRPLTDKDAEGVVLKWAVPTSPKAPTEEVQTADLDSYAKSAVEVEGVSASTESTEEQTSGDWFPIESCDELDAHH